MTVHPVRNNDCQLAGNPGKKNIRFGRCVVSGLPPGSTHIDLEMVDGAFHTGSYFIEGIPFVTIPLDAREHAEVHIFVSVSGASSFGCAAGFLTIADPLPLYHMYFGADPFVAV